MNPRCLHRHTAPVSTNFEALRCLDCGVVFVETAPRRELRLGLIKDQDAKRESLP